MNAIELHEAIKARLTEVREKGIWERSIFLMKLFKHMTGEDYSMDITGKISKERSVLAVPVRNRQFSVTRHRNRISSNCTQKSRIIIRVDETLVFEAEEVDDLFCENTIIVGKPEALICILVTSYVPGEWETYLNQEIIAKMFMDEQKKREEDAMRQKRQREQEALETEKAKPLTASERDLAKQFGIEV